MFLPRILAASLAGGAAVLAAMLMLAVSPVHADAPMTAHFDVIDSAFNAVPVGDPSNEVTVGVGGTVSFTMVGFGSHNASFAAGPAPTGCIQTAGEVFGAVPPLPTFTSGPPWAGECTFDNPGTYGFYCEAHGGGFEGEVFGMAGYVHVVEDAPADITPPTTTATVDPATPDGPDGKYLGPVQVSLSATDGDGSGVDYTEYRLNNPSGEFVVYSTPIVASAPGEYTLEYRSADNEGNVETVKTLDFEIVEPPPVATFLASDNAFTLTPGSGNQVTIYKGQRVAFAYSPGAGVNPHHLTFGTGPQPAGCVQTAGSGSGAVPPLPASPQGSGWAGNCTFTNPVVYRFYCSLHGAPASGMGGFINVIETLEDDETPPVSTHQLSPATPTGPGGAYLGNVNVTVNASDPGGEGVDFTEFRLDDPGGAFGEYSAPIAVSEPGEHTVEYRSVDLAGNVESTKTVTFEIAPPTPLLRAAAKPKKLNLAANRKSTTIKLEFSNTGSGPSGQIRVCASAPSSQLKVKGSKCINVAPVQPGAKRTVTFKFTVRPKAQGKTTSVKFKATGPAAPKAPTVKVKVKKAKK